MRMILRVPFLVPILLIVGSGLGGCGSGDQPGGGNDAGPDAATTDLGGGPGDDGATTDNPGVDGGQDGGADLGGDGAPWVNPGCTAARNVVTAGLKLDVWIDLADYQSGRYRVREKVTVTPAVAGDALSFFGENFELGWASAGYAYDQHLATFCTGAFEAGQEVSVEAEFVLDEATKTGYTALWGLGRYERGDHLVIGAFNEPYYVPLWLLVPQSTYAVDQTYDDSPGLMAIDLAIVAPDETWEVVGPGGPATVEAGDRPIAHFALHAPMPLYALSFAAAPDFEVFSVGKTASGVEVIGAVPADVRPNAEQVFPAAIVTIDWMEAAFGPYSFGDTLTLVGIPGFGGGMENASVIWFGNETLYPGTGGEFIVAHETVHQWWGDSVRFADWPHFWLAEGFDEWTTNYNLMAELTTPEEFAAIKLSYRKDGADLTYPQFAGFPPPGPLRFDDGEDMMQHFMSDLQLYYAYGAAFLEMVNQRLIRDHGTDLLAVLDAWYEAKKGQAATTEEFLAFLNEAAGDGAAWTALFDDWVYQTPVPTLTVSAYGYLAPTAHFTLAKTAGADQPVTGLEIVFVCGDQQITATADLPAGTKSVQVSADLPSAPTRIAIDPKQFYVFRLKKQGWAGPTVDFTL